MQGSTCGPVRVWIPIRSLGWVNIYPVGGGAGLVDAGMLTGRSVLSLARGLAGLGLSMGGVEAVLLTHFHVDHATLAPVVSLASGATVYVGEQDLEMLRGGLRRFVEEALQRFLESGVPSGEVRTILEAHPALRLEYAYEAFSDIELRPVRPGDTIRVGDTLLEAVHAPGHTPGSTIYIDRSRRLAYVGDVILQDITPHVTYHYEGTDPLGDYLETLNRIASWRGLTACPGHRSPIADPARRAREIIAHHEARLREIETLLRQGPMTAYEIARRVRWRTRYSSWGEYPPAERFFAIGETLAHLVHLENRGIVARSERGGVILWKLAK